MILGNICTRACGFCAVPSGKPLGPPEQDEPERVAEAVEKMGLRYAVVTSVNRDDQPDGGAAIFARTIEEIRQRVAGCRIEVLIPDFRGEWSALETVIGWIRAAGGVASLAHPTRYALSAGARRHLLADFTAAGGTSLEVVTGGNGDQHVDSCAALAVKHGLCGSVGSDFHSPQAAWNPLGRSLKLPDCVTPVWRSFGL